MQTALRKMGNSTGMIVPRAILGEIGLGVGATLDVRVEDGTIIATPIKIERRVRWADAAAAIDSFGEGDEADWQGFGNESDDALTW
jgi:antitoxin MazE